MLTEYIPEHGRRAVQRHGAQAHLIRPFLQFFTRLSGLGDTGEIALDIRHQHWHPQL